ERRRRGAAGHAASTSHRVHAIRAGLARPDHHAGDDFPAARHRSGHSADAGEAILMKALAAENVGLAFDGIVAVDDVSFSVESGKIFSIIGPNGAGKTTLFNIMSGIYRPSSGRVLLAGEDVTGLEPHMSAVENVMVGRHIREARNLTKSLLRFPSVGRQNRATRAKALELLQFVGL